ncbi:hypothetical protein EVAR_90462_1 [Eumeta japonica]|uniref:Uncharacterized protein n=1 Tax=Eumeta variegata TaxID=151549 RepID=A0A4C1SHQ5_EUMVA|nr:hypothetical protein EVAR_90462_1 [Eumeta japonica]
MYTSFTSKSPGSAASRPRPISASGATLPKEHITVLENVQHILNLAGSQAQWVLPSARCTQARRPDHLLATAETDHSPLPSFGEGGAPGEFVCTLVTRFRRALCRIGARPCPPQRSRRYVDQPVLTILHPPYRSLQRDHLSLEDRAEGSGVEYQVSSPSRHSVRGTDFALNTASVGVDLRPDHRETVHRLESGRRSRTDLGHVRGVSKSPKYGSLELPVDKVSPKSFALHLIQPGRLPHPYVERAASKDQRGMQGLCGEPGALRATLRWTASSICRTPSCRRCPSARCVQHGWLDYGNVYGPHDLRTQTHVALAARAKPYKYL